MVLESTLLILMGYLLGSVPAAYLAGRWLRGIDLRHYGSGTVGGSMVWEHVTRWAVVPAGLFDVLKASLPVWLSLQRDLGPWVAAGAGLAAAIGHNWPLFLGFTGGRAVSCFLGIWLVLFPWGFPWMLAFLAVGYLLGDSAPWTLASLVTLPMLSHLVDGPAVVLPAAGAMLLLTFVKRVEANRRPLPSKGPERWRVLLRRLFLDRDIASHRDWIRRQPDSGGGAEAGR